MNWKKFFFAIMTLAIPVAIQNVLVTTASMVDTIMLGSMGEMAVAAVGICSQITGLYIQLYWGFLSAAIIFFSQYWGAEDEDGINRMFGFLTLLMAVIGVSFGLMCVLKPSLLLGIYTDKEILIEIGTPYMRIAGWGYILQIFALEISCFLRSTERVKAPLFISIAALLVNFIVNYILIYGRYGFPRLGAAGAAYGTLLSHVVNLVLLLAVLLKSKSAIRLRLSKLFHFRDGFAFQYLKKAAPVVANEALYGVGQMLINISIGHQEETAIAAMAAFRVCEGFVMSFFFGLSSAASVLVGKNVGAGEPDNAYDTARKAALFCPAITFTIIGILCLTYRPLFLLFGLGDQALYYARWTLLIYLVFGAIRTSNYIMNDTIRAGGESVFGSVVEVGGLFLAAVPLTWLAGMVWEFPFLVVFAFIYSDELLRFPILWSYILSGRWIKPVTEQGRAAAEEFLTFRKRKRMRE